MELLELLDRPGREYTPFPFWFLNDTLRREEICRQLQDFASHGVYGVVLHPRIGLPQEMGYLSEAFFQAIEWAVREAERLGMQVILYDEGMYPSGSACGQVVAANPAFASRGIDWVPQPEEGDQVLAATPEGVLVSRFTWGTIRGIHFGEDDGEPGAPPSTDLLNPDAVDLFIRLTHEAYYRRLKPWFGGTIIAFFTDEPSIMGRDPRTPFAWTPGLEKEFTAAGGVLADLAALFRGEENPSTRLYHQMILEKEGSVYYRRLSEWCAGHGIALVGHPHRSDDIEVERWFQIPGQDLALRWVAPRHHAVDGIDSTMGHCSADAALLMGCRRNANECFGACNRDGNPWQLSGGDIKWYLDWLSVRGVNLFIPHAFYYSIEGPRKEERPPDVGPHSIWWGHYTLWSDYMRRLSALLTDAEVLVRVALPCRNRDLHPEIAAALQQAQIGYCYLPESVWPDCTLQDGRLHCRGLVFDGVAGDASFFPGLPHWGRPDFEAIAPDCLCQPARPELRVRHFRRSGVECWLLVNEGEETLETRVTFPGAACLGGYDLWEGRAFRLARGERCPVRLPRRSSLLVFACGAADWEALPLQPRVLWLEPAAFRLVEQRPEAVQKVYEAECVLPPDASNWDSIRLPVQAKEMCELTVNGQDAGAAFWSPCSFELAGLARPGANRLRLTVTGSLANRYGVRPVPYGLGVKETF